MFLYNLCNSSCRASFVSYSLFRPPRISQHKSTRIMYIEQSWELWPQGGFTCLLEQWKFWLHSWSALCKSSYEWAYVCLTLCRIYCHYWSSEHRLENLRAKTSNCLLHYFLYWHVCIRFSLLLSCVIFANTLNGRSTKQQNIIATFLWEIQMCPAKKLLSRAFFWRVWLLSRNWWNVSVIIEVVSCYCSLQLTFRCCLLRTFFCDLFQDLCHTTSLLLW